MRRILALAFVFSFFTFGATAGFAQVRIAGKWATDWPVDPLTIADSSRKQSAQLVVTIDDAKASATLTLGGLGGTFYAFKDGKVTGNKIQFQSDPRSTEPTWTIEMVDDNTAMLYRESFPVVPNNRLDRPTAVIRGGDVNDSIRGIVQDHARALIPGVTITATNVDTGAAFTTVTDAAGRYGFSSVVSGRYSITASLPGFKTTAVNNLSIGGTPILQDLTLEPAVARASAIPTPASCSQNGIVWCILLHRLER